MNTLKWMKDYPGNKFYPYTHTDAVLVGNDEENLRNLTDELNQINNKINESVSGTQSDWKEEANILIKDLSNDPDSGIITVTRMDNTTFTINIPKSLVFKSAIFYEETNEIIITWSDDSQSRIPVEGLIDIYTGSIGDIIQISVSEDNIISATVKEGSINRSLLSSDIQESIQSVVEHLNHTQSHLPEGGNVGQIVGMTDNGIGWIVPKSNDNSQITPTKISQLENDCGYISELDLTNALAQKIDKVDGMGLSSNDYSSDQKEKLLNIENGANKYIHPETHPASMITEDETHQFVTSEEKALIGISNLPNVSFDEATSKLIIGEKEIDLSSLKGSDILNNGGELTPGFGNNMLWKTFNTDGISINRVDCLNGNFVAIGGTYLFYGTEFPLQKINLQNFTDNKSFSLINIHYYFNNYYILGLDETSENNISYIFKTDNFNDFEVKIIADTHKFLGLFYNGNNYIALSDKNRDVYVRNVGKWDDDFLTGETMVYCSYNSYIYDHRDWIVTPTCMDFPKNNRSYFKSSDMWQNSATTGTADSSTLFIDKSHYYWQYVSSYRYYRLINDNGEIVWNNENYSSSNTYYKKLYFNAGIKCNGKLFLISNIYGLFINDFSELDNILENNFESSFLIISSNIKFITHNYEYVAASTDNGELLYAKIS